MKIERLKVNRTTLEAFADEHGFVMEIGERTRTDLHPSFPYERNRFYASFKDVDTKDGACISGTHGNGGTEEEAMADYARQISGKLLVVNAFNKETRREVWAPELHLSEETNGA